MKKLLLVVALHASTLSLFAQADNEIQVYASPTIGNKMTIFELHSNYTIRGPKTLTDPATAHWENETLEITHGFGKNFELGFYTFTGFSPSGGYHYLGNQIRPRVTAPARWNWPLGASLSLEAGFFRPHTDSAFIWQGELRPIFDRTWGNFYLSFNPNIEFVLSGEEKGAEITPQLKAVYTLKNTYGVGVEYYSALGSFREWFPVQKQEHLLGPALDFYFNPKWEINAGYFFGLTDNSNQRIFKILLGRRIGGK